jgi:glycosyltransferase involved in cell wall biosynthesis
MLINGRFLTRPATGVDRFAMELLRALTRQQPNLDMRVVIPESASLMGQLPGQMQLERGGGGLGQRWEQWALPQLARDEPLINLCNTAPLWREQQMVVVHDVATLANPLNFSLAFRSWYRVMLTALTRRSRVLASVSRFSADELIRYFGARASGVEVVGEGGEHILREPADTTIINRLGLAGRRYVLAVGSQSPNKNLAAVVKAIHLLDDPDLLLVAAGGGNSRVFAGGAVSDERLISTGYVSDAQLRALYEHASCFAFPSFYEGFGLPPLEAMCCGCPVVVSDRSSLPEVCGEAALYCDPSDPATLAAQLRGLLSSEAARDDMREAGRARAASLTWDRAARQFADIVQANFAGVGTWA